MNGIGLDRHGLAVIKSGRAIRELPPSERPRERLQLRGPAGLTAAELIGLLWGSGARGRSAVDLAADALARFDGLTGLSRASGPELEGVPGVGEARAAQLQAAFELGRRLLADWPAGRWSVRSPRDLADRLVLQMGRLEREELRVVILNTKNVVLRVVTVYTGNISSSLVRVGELFRDAVRLDAAGIILVHNHPSGDPTPSPDDLHLTARVACRGAAAGHRSPGSPRHRTRRLRLVARPGCVVRSDRSPPPGGIAHLGHSGFVE